MFYFLLFGAAVLIVLALTWGIALLLDDSDEQMIEALRNRIAWNEDRIHPTPIYNWETDERGPRSPTRLHESETDSR